MTEKRSRLVTYDTMDDDDAKFGVGLGVTVLSRC